MVLGFNWTTLSGFVTVAVFYVIYWIFLVYRRWSIRYAHLAKLPGVKFDKYLGALSEFPGPGEEGFKFIREYTPSYPRLAHMFMGPFQVQVALTHPETIKTILKTSEPKPLQISGYYFALPWLGQGLLTSGGKKWARNRRLLTPAFHFDILKPYTLVNNRAADTLVKKMQTASEQDQPDGGQYFEVFSWVSLCTLEVILKCAFSFQEDVQGRGDDHPYVKAVQTLVSQMVSRMLRPWLYPDFMYFLSPSGREFKRCCDLVHKISADVIQSRKATLKLDENSNKPSSKRMLDFLDILLTAQDDNGKGLTDREIRDEVDTFLFEGHDTTASGISWMLYSLAQNPDWQLRCQQEIDSILEGRDNDDILWEDLPKLKILTACLKESLRMHTPVPIIERETSKDMYIDGYFIPKGVVVDIHLYAMMHNEMVWDDPLTYKPERFLEDQSSKLDTYAFLPFSAGPRNCIGQHFAMHEMKVIVAKVLKRFHLDVDPDRPAKHNLAVVMKSEDGMYLKAEPRQSQY